MLFFVYWNGEVYDTKLPEDTLIGVCVLEDGGTNYELYDKKKNSGLREESDTS